MKENEILVIPRRSGKRLTVIAKAMQLAKEGKKVAILDIGGQVKVLNVHGDWCLFKEYFVCDKKGG